MKSVNIIHAMKVWKIVLIVTVLFTHANIKNLENGLEMVKK